MMSPAEQQLLHDLDKHLGTLRKMVADCVVALQNCSHWRVLHMREMRRRADVARAELAEGNTLRRLFVELHR
jgi:hypothetical protein